MPAKQASKSEKNMLVLYKIYFEIWKCILSKSTLRCKYESAMSISLTTISVYTLINQLNFTDSSAYICTLNRISGILIAKNQQNLADSEWRVGIFQYIFLQYSFEEDIKYSVSRLYASALFNNYSRLWIPTWVCFEIWKYIFSFSALRIYELIFGHRLSKLNSKCSPLGSGAWINSLKCFSK